MGKLIDIENNVSGSPNSKLVIHCIVIALLLGLRISLRHIMSMSPLTLFSPCYVLRAATTLKYR